MAGGHRLLTILNLVSWWGRQVFLSVACNGGRSYSLEDELEKVRNLQTFQIILFVLPIFTTASLAGLAVVYRWPVMRMMKGLAELGLDKSSRCYVMTCLTLKFSKAK